MKRGICPEAYASDVRRGPLSRAEKNVAEAGLSEKITLRLADGLDGAEGFDPDTVIIAGMGGELIADIIGRAEFVKVPEKELILQPMTCADELRRYLLGSGFSIMRERLAYEDRHIYQIFTAKYTGSPQKYSEAELQVGRDHEDTELVFRLYEKYLKKYEKMITGRTAAGSDVEDVLGIYGELKEKYEDRTALQKS